MHFLENLFHNEGSLASYGRETKVSMLISFSGINEKSSGRTLARCPGYYNGLYTSALIGVKTNTIAMSSLRHFCGTKVRYRANFVPLACLSTHSFSKVGEIENYLRKYFD